MKHLQSAMQSLPISQLVAATGAMHTRPIRAFLVSLLLAVPACVGVPQVQSGNHRAGEIQEHLRRAQVALQANDVVTAETEFRAILIFDPKNAAAHTNLGILALGHNDCRTASAEFRSALAAQPSLTKTQ